MLIRGFIVTLILQKSAQLAHISRCIQSYLMYIFYHLFFKRAAQQKDLMETLIWTSVAGCLLVKQILESLFQLD